MRLGNILTERTEKNSDGYAICSVSVTKGIVNQVDYLGRSFAAQDTTKYNVVYHDDIVYTKSPTGDFPYGIIKRSEQECKVAVSPLYGVYVPRNHETSIFIHHYFCNPRNALNYLHPLIQKGAKNTINITNGRFLENYIDMPDGETMPTVVRALELLSKRIGYEERCLAALSHQKVFLQRNMFV